MNIIPDSIIIRRVLEAFSTLKFGTLHFTTPRGERITFKGKEAGPEAEFLIEDWSVMRNAVARGDIGLGEDYIEGKWHTDSMENLFTLFLLNLDELDGLAHGNILNRLGFLFNNRLLRRNSKHGSSKNIQAHYDVGNDFYSLWLDRTMTYSSALFKHDGEELESAQHNKYQRIIDKSEGNGDSVLEVGCGWGGFAEQAACSRLAVTGLTVSPAQHDFAKRRLNGSADIRLQDYRDVQGTFDMIVSIEMFEAVGQRYWPNYFRMLSERLKKNGRAVIQTIAVEDEIFDDYVTRSDFIRHYVFPGGMLPSLKKFRAEAAKANLKCVDTFSFGHDYAETLRRWNKRFKAQHDSILALGHDRAFIRNWEFYLGICTASFAVNRTNVAQVELVHA
jgi:cyclopropane-fatty-acyl-phospholipid synthase